MTWDARQRVNSRVPAILRNIKMVQWNNNFKNRYFHLDKMKQVQVIMNQYRPPPFNGEPGHLIVDAIYQGDRSGRKGIYHINAVDEVTRFENPSHFTKSFKAAYGSSPAQHRAAHFRVTAIEKGEDAFGPKGLDATARLGKTSRISK